MVMPLSEAVTELRLVIERAEQRAPHAVDRDDHRTEVIADLLDAIDRFDPGWGMRLMSAMYLMTDAPETQR